MAAKDPNGTPPAIDRRRFRRVRRFFLGVFAHAVWHDVILAWPGLRTFRREPLPRWQAIARRYRALAADMGGVLIKLGQYLSVRVDVIPPAVAQELAGLQDEVPAASFAAVVKQISTELGRPADDVFPFLAERPLGAASLAQVHEARLVDGTGVVVKVLRPGIEQQVETDLAAIAMAIRWLKLWGFVRRRVDLDWLIDEFSTTTRSELDLRREGTNAERFAALFADDNRIAAPAIHWPTTSQRLLTQHRVDYIKIGDTEALTRAGIDRGEIASTLYRAYMEQMFVHHFVHADPHPGNLFIEPLAGHNDPDGFVAVPGDPTPPGTERGFRVHFVDFGMVAEVPERLRSALREYVIGFGNRDAQAVIQAYAKAGILLPGADLEHLEEALEAVFERFWGVDVGSLSGRMRNEGAGLWREFSRLLLETPVQVQVDLMFASRAIELLVGLVTQLDERFDPWNETMPFARQLAREATHGWAGRLAAEAQTWATVPGNASRVLAQARRGRLTVRAGLAPDTRRQLTRLEKAQNRVASNVLTAGFLIAGAVLYPHAPTLGTGLLVVAGALVLRGLFR